MSHKITKTNRPSVIIKLLILLVLLLNFSGSLYGAPSVKKESSLKNNHLLRDNLRVEPFAKGYRLEEGHYLKKTLPNGLKLMVKELPDTGVVCLYFAIKTGSMEEMDSLPGTTTLIQKMILRGGGKDRLIPLEELTETDGCMISSDADADMARITLVSTPDAFRVNFKRLAEVIKNPDFSEEAVESEKERLCRRVEGNQSAFLQIKEIFLKEFYRYHPYRSPIYGSKNTIKRLKSEKLRQFFNRYYVANRMSVAIVGDIQGRDAMSLAEKLLSDIPRYQEKSVDIPWEPVGQEKRLYLATYSNNAWIFVGFPAPSIKHPDYAAMKILSTVLGEGLSSRLFMELREKEGLAYSLSSNYPKLEGPSHMVVFVVTDQKNLSRSRKKLFEQVNRIKKDGISQEELQAAKKKIFGQHLLNKETAAQQAHSMAYYSALDLDQDFDEALMRRVESATVRQVQDAARKYLQNYTVLLIESVPPGRADDDDDD